MTKAVEWKRGGYERGAYWAIPADGRYADAAGFAVHTYNGQDEESFQAACRQAQRQRDIWIRTQNKG